MIRSHAVTSPDPIQEGGSTVAICGKPIVNVHWLCITAVYEGEMPDPLSTRVLCREITCHDCLFGDWNPKKHKKIHVYAAIEAEEYEWLKSKGRVTESFAS